MNNRRGNSTAVWSQNRRPKQRHPTIHVLPDEVAIRVVCHASAIGGIIGSNGDVVSKLRSETGTKIHCHPPANGSSHWIVFIVGSKDVEKRFLLTDRVGDFHGEEHKDWVTCEVSAVQMALIRVLERSWEVLAEKDSDGFVDGEDDEAYCGILADRNQIGAVLGLGGKNVESMRKHSGAMIRVLPPPSCGTNNDELIQVTGEVLAVKKALVMVSNCLQITPPLNGHPPPLCSKDYESSSTNGNSKDPHSEFFPNLRSSLSNASETTASYRHLPSPYEEGNSSQDSEDTERTVVFKIICTDVVVGGIIGKQGSIIRALQNETGATISIGPKLRVSGEQVVTISARENLESRYSHAQHALALVYARSVDIDVENGRIQGLHNGALVKAKLLVPPQFAYSLVGNGNRDAIIATGADVYIPVGDPISDWISENEVVIVIKGGYSNVQKALSLVTSKFRDNLLPKMVLEGIRVSNLQPSQQNASRGDSLSISNGEQDLKKVRSSTELMKSNYFKHTDEALKEMNEPKFDELFQPAQQNANRGDSLWVSSGEQDLKKVISSTEQMKSIDYFKPSEARKEMNELIVDRLFRPSQQNASRVDSLSVPNGEQDLKKVSSSTELMKLIDYFKHTEALREMNELKVDPLFQPSQQNASRGDSLSVSNGEQDLKKVRSGTELMKSIDYFKHTEAPKEVNEHKGITLPESLLDNDLTNETKQLQISSNGDVSCLPQRSKGVSLRNVTLELAIDKDAFGSIYGRYGTGLATLKQTSGAKVVVKDPTIVTVLISGSPEETHKAMSFIDSILADQ